MREIVLSFISVGFWKNADRCGLKEADSVANVVYFLPPSLGPFILYIEKPYFCHFSLLLFRKFAHLVIEQVLYVIAKFAKNLPVFFDIFTL